MPAKYQSNRTAVEAAFKAKFQRGAINIGGDILRLSAPMTPWRDGDLRQRRRVVPKSNGAEVRWESDHAAVQNKGRRAGSRPFTNYTTEGTGPGFVEKGIEAVTARLKEYFR